MQDVGICIGCIVLGVGALTAGLWWVGRVAKEDLDEKGLRHGRAWDKDWKE